MQGLQATRSHDDGQLTCAGKNQSRDTPQRRYRSMATAWAPEHRNDSSRKGLRPRASLSRPTTGLCARGGVSASEGMRVSAVSWQTKHHALGQSWGRLIGLLAAAKNRLHISQQARTSTSRTHWRLLSTLFPAAEFRYVHKPHAPAVRNARSCLLAVSNLSSYCLCRSCVSRAPAEMRGKSWRRSRTPTSTRRPANARPGTPAPAQRCINLHVSKLHAPGALQLRTESGPT